MLVVPPWSMLEKLLLAAICAATLFFTLVTPPFQAPDENQHYMKALLLSDGRFLPQQQGGRVGADLPRAALDLHDVDFPTEVPPEPRLFDQAMLTKAWTADAARPGRAFGDFPNVANYAPTLYAPGAAGLSMGDALGLPRLGAFYIGRLVNALTALAMLSIALYLLPFGRNAFLATALLPTFCYQNGSLSPDAVINGLGFLGLALALRVGFMGSAPLRSAGLFLTTPLLALAKGVYLPLMAAGLRWPLGRRDRRVLLLLAAMVFGAAFFLLWMKMSGGSQTLYHIVSRKTGESVMTAPLAAQLAVLLHDPLAYVRVLFASVAERSPVYVLQIVGRFGWNAILLPLAAYALAAVMLGAGVLSGSGARFGIGQRLWWLAVAAGTALLIETAMYLTGTELDADYIQGTQGRYFLPVLPLALLAVMPAGPVRGARVLFAGAALILLAVAALCVVDSFWVHGFVTTDGMPPHQSVTKAFLLPSPRW
ncbi:Predicted membrane protein [Sphingobium faniae]|nr:Predicted membrane protein [Sphingobium faniae]